MKQVSFFLTRSAAGKNLKLAGLYLIIC